MRSYTLTILLRLFPKNWLDFGLIWCYNSTTSGSHVIETVTFICKYKNSKTECHLFFRVQFGVQSLPKGHFVSPSMRSTLVIDDHDNIHIMRSMPIHADKTKRFDRMVQHPYSIVDQI